MTGIAEKLAQDFLTLALGDDEADARSIIEEANSHMGEGGPAQAVEDSSLNDDQSTLRPSVATEAGRVLWVQFWSGNVQVEAATEGDTMLETVTVVELTDAQRATLKDRGADLWAI